MKFSHAFALSLLAIGPVLQLHAQKNQNMINKQDSLSYAIGVSIGQNLQSQNFDSINYAALADGIKDFMEGKGLKMTEEQIGTTISQYMSAKQKAQEDMLAGAGREFLAKNAKRPGVVTLPSGLQYEVITEGNGPKPKPTDKVTTHYHGTLIDGKVFDSSVERGQPATFPVNGVIRGWQEALVLMPVGSKWKLYIPHELAYGERGAGGAIGPYSTLVFEVELLSINN